MKLILILVSSFVLSHSMAQNSNKEMTSIKVNSDFEVFVDLNAISFFPRNSKIPANTATIELKSESTSSLKELGLSAFEDKAQYFYVNGTDKVLKIESLYRLRLMYQAQTKN